MTDEFSNETMTAARSASVSRLACSRHGDSAAETQTNSSDNYKTSALAFSAILCKWPDASALEVEAVAFPLIVSRDATELISEISFLQKVMRLPNALGVDSAPLIHLTRSALLRCSPRLCCVDLFAVRCEKRINNLKWELFMLEFVAAPLSACVSNTCFPLLTARRNNYERERGGKAIPRGWKGGRKEKTTNDSFPLV